MLSFFPFHSQSFLTLFLVFSQHAGTYHYILWLIARRAKEFYLPTTLVYGPGYTTAVLYVGDLKCLKEV